MPFTYSLEAVIIALVTFFVYFFTVNSFTKSSAPFLFVFCLVAIVFLCIWLLNGVENVSSKNIFYRLLIFLAIAAVLLGVGSTGWFTSPFFYIVYCMAFALAFLFSPIVSFTFVLTIVALLLLHPNILYTVNSVLSIISLFLLVPFSYLLTNVHLKFKQKEKSILILTDDIESNEFETKAQQLLHNKVIKFASELREDLSDIKQLTYFSKKAKSVAELEKTQGEILYSVEEGLKILQEFEIESTGTAPLPNPRIS